MVGTIMVWLSVVFGSLVIERITHDKTIHIAYTIYAVIIAIACTILIYPS